MASLPSLILILATGALLPGLVPEEIRPEGATTVSRQTGAPEPLSSRPEEGGRTGEGRHSHARGGPEHSDDNDDATTHHSFAQVDHWVEVFEDPGRAEWQKPEEVVGALRLEAGMNVADIGAGTGYFNPHLARAVGAGGRVFAADIEPAMVEYMTGRAVRETTPNVTTILAAPGDPKLPEAALDVVMIVNTYHHIDDRLEYFSRLKRTLRPGGRLAVIDFHKKELPVGPSPEHKLPREHVIGELESGGWRLTAEHGFLPYQYFLIFEPE